MAEVRFTRMRPHALKMEVMLPQTHSLCFDQHPKFEFGIDLAAI
jgi:hypothetical protein